MYEYLLYIAKLDLIVVSFGLICVLVLWLEPGALEWCRSGSSHMSCATGVPVCEPLKPDCFALFSFFAAWNCQFQPVLATIGADLVGTDCVKAIEDWICLQLQPYIAST